MNVTYTNSIEYKVLQLIEQSSTDVILRQDVAHLAGERQISRALRSLVKKRRITKIGYGIYARMNYSKKFDKTYLPQGFLLIAREALTRLGVEWDLSESEKDYNEGRSQQIPINPPTVVFERFRRKLGYKGMDFSVQSAR